MLSKEDARLLLNIVDDLIDNKDSEPFRQPVDYKALNLIDYPIIIKHPMDLNTVKKKLRGNKYKSFSDTLDDIQLIWNNCKLYNQEGSPIYKQAQKLEKYTKKLIKKYLPNFKVSAVAPPLYKNKSEHVAPHMQEESKTEAPGQDYDFGKKLFNQKVKFSQKIKKLTQEQLVKVIQLVLDGCPNTLKEISKEKMQIKVDDLTAETLQRINSYMDDIFSAEDKHME